MRLRLPRPIAAMVMAVALNCLSTAAGQAQTSSVGASTESSRNNFDPGLLGLSVLPEPTSTVMSAISSVSSILTFPTSNSTLNQIEQGLATVQSEASGFQKTLHNDYGLNLHGLFAVWYLYNFDNPITGNNLFRVYDYFGSNNIEPGQGEIYLDRTVPNQLGFVIDLNTFNTGLKQYGSVTTYWDVPGPRGGCSGSPCSWLDPTRAYLQYTIPIGNGILVTAGNQFSLIGYEQIPSWQNVNLFESIGYLFEDEPFITDGIRAHYDFNSQVGLTLGANNGWNNLASQNPLQTFEGQLQLKPLSWLSYTLDGMYGNIQANSNAKSGIIDNYATVTPTNKLSLTTEGYWGHQDPGAFLPTPIIQAPGYPFNPLLFSFPAGILTHSADWWGVGTWIAYNITDRLQVGLRGEVFDDEDGFLTGIPQRLWEITTGVNYKITEWLLTRFEYRHDESSAHPFPGSSREVTFPCPGLGSCSASARTFSGMDTIMFTVIYFF